MQYPPNNPGGYPYTDGSDNSSNAAVDFRSLDVQRHQRGDGRPAPQAWLVYPKGGGNGGGADGRPFTAKPVSLTGKAVGCRERERIGRGRDKREKGRERREQELRERKIWTTR